MKPTSQKPTLSRDYFESLYARNPDPWNFQTKPYELEKYAATLQNLPRESYGRALELGCSIGVLSEKLAPRCESLRAIDTSENALQSARLRCENLKNTQFLRATLPDEFPVGQYDLILMSEVGYYFSRPDLASLQEKIWESLAPGGDLVLVHYLPFVPDYPLRGDEVHQAFFDWGKLEFLKGFRAERYRFDAFRKRL